MRSFVSGITKQRSIHQFLLYVKDREDGFFAPFLLKNKEYEDFFFMHGTAEFLKL